MELQFEGLLFYASRTAMINAIPDLKLQQCRLIYSDNRNIDCRSCNQLISGPTQYSESIAMGDNFEQILILIVSNFYPSGGTDISRRIINVVITLSTHNVELVNGRENDDKLMKLYADAAGTVGT